MSTEQSSESGGELRPYVPSTELAIPTGPGRPIEASFDPRTPEGARLLIEATLGEPAQLATLANKTIVVSHWFAHDAVAAGKAEGEQREFRRVVVFTEKGEAYSCGSQGVDKAVHVIELMIGKAPWIPGVPCEVRVSKTGSGGMWMILYPDMKHLAARMTPASKKK